MARAKSGTYDELARTMRELVQADAVIVIVCGGQGGDGFSLICDGAQPELLQSIPRVLLDASKTVQKSLDAQEIKH